MNDIADDPHSPISQIYKQAINCNLPYIKHYVKLHREFNDADECMRFYNVHDNTTRMQNIHVKGIGDPDSIFGSYLQINSKLRSPSFYHKYTCNEYERIILSKYRTGGHSLKIRTGRFEGLQIENRLCKCQKDIQTLQHVIFQCELTETIRLNEFGCTNLEEFFANLRNAADKLRKVEAIFKLQY